MLSDFKARALRSIPTPSMVVLIEIFHEDAGTNIHPLPELWYLVSCSLLYYLSSYSHMMSNLCLASEALSSVSWFIVFHIVTFKVTMVTTFLHLRKFCLGFVVDFSNIGVRPPKLGLKCWNATSMPWYYVHFWISILCKGINNISYQLNITITVLLKQCFVIK